MLWRSQRTRGQDRHTITLRMPCFLRHDGYLLLLRGDPTKRLWAGRLNGIGGHIESGETPLESAQREL